MVESDKYSQTYLKAHFTICVGEVKKADGVFWREGNLPSVEVLEESLIHLITELLDFNCVLLILHPVVLMIPTDDLEHNEIFNKVSSYQYV